MTAIFTMAIAGLFLVIVCAPESWQTRPWTAWERCAQFLLIVFGWPLTAAAILQERVGWSMSDKVATPFFLLLFLASGAFWAAAVQTISKQIRKRTTPNQTSDATSETAGAASSWHQG